MNGDKVDAKLKHRKVATQFTRRDPLTKQDFTINNHGSVVLLVPNTEAAKDWADEHIGKDNGFQPYWPTMLFEPRYVAQVVHDIQAQGLSVR